MNYQILIVGFGIIISFFLGFGLFTLTTIHNLSHLTTTIYNHPLVVSNAALQANALITKMHRNMKDVVLSDSKSDVDRFVRAVNKEELNTYKHLDIVKSKILGEEGQQLERTARNQFANWKSIRNEVINLVEQRNRTKAAAITLGKGAKHVELLEKKMQGLTHYARKKATDFIAQKDKEYKKAKAILILFLISSISASLIISFFTLTQSKKAGKILESSEERYKTQFQMSSDAIFLVEIETLRFLDANEAAIALYGYSRKELLQMKATDLSTEEEKTKKAIQKNHDASIPMRYHKKKDGTIFPVEITANNITLNSKEINISSIRDITDRIESDKKIKSSLKEKEILLKEIHHRVKNNMQVIQSLLSLQLNMTENPEQKKLLIDSGNRIKSMALIHETLYGSEDIAHLNIKTYFDNIVQHLFKIYNKSNIHVEINVDIQLQDLNLDCCIACGLIINELTSNALKYAFENTTKGNLAIFLNKTDEKNGHLIVKDDGCGLPADFNIEGFESLGLKIVRILVQGQLNGHLTVTSENGAMFEIKFPLTSTE